MNLDHPKLQILCIAFTVIAMLGIYTTALAEEQVLDTGRIKLVLGKPGGGFIDEAFLDMNGNGEYTPDELVAFRPEGEPGIVVECGEAPDSYESGSILVGNTTRAEVIVQAISKDTGGNKLEAVIEGTLDFGKLGKSPFTVTIDTNKDSTTLVCGVEFAPLKHTRPLLLVSAGLRVFCKYMAYGGPRGPRGIMSVAGTFRNTPRPKGPSQPLTWQIGGRLVESPLFWRDWKAWSEACSALTMNQGRLPEKFLTFHMYDPSQGMIMAMKHPALTSPNELFGQGLPPSVTAYAWPPHSPPLDLRARGLPERFFVKNIGLDFFPVSPGKFKPNFEKIAEERIRDAKKTLEAALGELESNLLDPRFPKMLLETAKERLAKAAKTGWTYEQSLPAPQVRGAVEPSGKVFGEDWVTLRIDVPYKLPVKGMPICGGIPLPKGVCNSDHQAILLDETGNEIPAQMQTLAVWPDNSVKWLLVQAFIDIKPPRSPEIRLAFGPDKARKAKPRHLLRVEKTNDGYSVDTGVIRFTLSKGNSGLFDRVWMDQNGDNDYTAEELIISAEKNQRRNSMDLARVSDTADYEPYYYSVSNIEKELSDAKVEEIVIERQGPISVDLHVKGRFHHAKLSVGLPKRKNLGCEFWVRITAYAGKPYLKIKHTYVFEGNPDLEFINSLGIALKPQLKEPTRISIGDENEDVVVDASGATLAGITQDNPYNYFIWHSGGPDQSTAIQSVGHSAPGWIDLSDEKRGVTLGMRHMREMHAKELAYEHGSLVAYVWPKRARLLDTRRYSRQWGSGESTSYGQGMAIGVSRTTDMFVYFHTGNGQPAAIVQVFNDPPILMTYPAWYASTQAFGPFHPYDMKKFPKLEAAIETWTDYWIYHQDLWSWYGIYDYGDFQSVNKWDGSWASDRGRWGWINNEALVDMAFWLQFLRTGRRDYQRAAEACSRHTLEVDLINSTQYKTGQNVKMRGHRHNVNHWGDGYVGMRVNACTGFKLYYFLTGDLRTKDQLEMILKQNLKRLNRFHSSADSIGAALSILMYKWEATGDKQYYDRLKSFVDFSCDYEEEHGVFPGKVPGWDFRNNKMHFPDESVSGGAYHMFYQNFGAGHTLNEFAELSAHERLKKSIVNIALDVQKRPSWQWQVCFFPLQAAAYRYTGDHQFRDWILTHGKLQWVDPRRDRWPTRKCVFGDGKCMFGAWITHGVPYLMDIMAKREGFPEPEFQIPAFIRIREGPTAAEVDVDGSATKKGSAEFKEFKWIVGNKPAVTGMRAKLEIPPGNSHVILKVIDVAGQSSIRRKAVTVWPPGFLQLCFSPATPPGFFFVRTRYDEVLGIGFVSKFSIDDTSEPRPQLDRGCKCRRVLGKLQMRLRPGTYQLEMGGTDYWSTHAGRVTVQGKTVQEAINQKGRKLSWKYAGDVTVGEDGILAIVFGEGEKDYALVSYVIVTKK